MDIHFQIWLLLIIIGHLIWIEPWGAFLKHLWWILKISCLKLPPNRNGFWIQPRIWSSSWNLTGGTLLDYSIIMPSYFEYSNKDFKEEQSASRSVLKEPLTHKLHLFQTWIGELASNQKKRWQLKRNQPNSR